MAVILTVAGSAATAHAQYTPQSLYLSDVYYDYEVYIHNPFIGSGFWGLVGTYDRRATAEAWAESFSETGWDVRIEPVYAPPVLQPYYQRENLYFRP